MPIKTIKKIPRVTRDHIALIMVSLAFAAFGAAATIGINQISTSSEKASEKATVSKVLSEATINGARESCHKFGNPLRKGLREFFEDQREKALHPDPALLKKLNLTAKEARELSVDTIKQYNYDINVRFADVPCGKVYNADRAKPDTD